MQYSNGEEAAYLAGLREGRLDALEDTVKELTNDVARLKTAHYMLYGAIALVQFLPELRRLVG
jgi:hypothetical protein